MRCFLQGAGGMRNHSTGSPSQTSMRNLGWRLKRATGSENMYLENGTIMAIASLSFFPEYAFFTETLSSWRMKIVRGHPTMLHVDPHRVSINRHAKRSRDAVLRWGHSFEHHINMLLTDQGESYGGLRIDGLSIPCTSRFLWLVQVLPKHTLPSSQ